MKLGSKRRHLSGLKFLGFEKLNWLGHGGSSAATEFSHRLSLFSLELPKGTYGRSAGMGKQTRFGTLRKVSGQLRRIFSGESIGEEPQMPGMLIVDDEGSICFSMSEYFGLHGYKVDTANELDEAERLIENNKYEVAILDLRLGLAHNADGLIIIKLLHERRPETRIVVLTAYGSAEMEDEARQLGADAFLRKPKPLSQVAQVIQGLLDSPSKHVVRSA